ncbi:TetR/AcrR family transcriptional regulator [Marinicaulis aureus]|uniref:TetR/AcrR family transcriptional regulator n=1 Tax=Hyphococcus aureus TaxID=2666033 RepID=A0ABW1KW89_9PROT
MKAKAKQGSIKEQVSDLKWKAVIDTAIELFHKNGYRGTSIDMIADELGVTKPFIYYRFKSKADLLTGVFAHAEEVVAKDAQKILQGPETPDVKYYNIVRQFVETACEHWKLLSVFYNEEHNLPERKLGEVRRIRREWIKSIASLLEEGRNQGYFKFGDVEITVNALMGMVIWIYQWMPNYKQKDHDFIAKELTGCAMALVGSQSPARPGKR